MEAAGTRTHGRMLGRRLPWDPRGKQGLEWGRAGGGHQKGPLPWGKDHGLDLYSEGSRSPWKHLLRLRKITLVVIPKDRSGPRWEGAGWRQGGQGGPSNSPASSVIILSEVVPPLLATGHAPRPFQPPNTCWSVPSTRNAPLVLTCRCLKHLLQAPSSTKPLPLDSGRDGILKLKSSVPPVMEGNHTQSPSALLRLDESSQRCCPTLMPLSSP